MAETRGLIVLGNARVGKSYLVNILADTDFENKISATAVTTQLQTSEVSLSNGKGKLLIFNLPGLVDLQNKDTMERNKSATRDAFIQCPNSVIGFVYKWKNGSVALEDVTAFNAVNKAYNVQEESLLFIVNQCEIADPESEATLTLLLRKLTNKPNVKVVFIPQITDNDQKKQVQVDLFSQLTQLKSSHHEESKENPLDLNENAEQVKGLEAQLAQLKADLERKEQSVEAERSKVKEQIAKQADDLQKTKEELKSAQASAQVSAQNGGGGHGIFAHVGKALDTIFGF